MSTFQPQQSLCPIQLRSSGIPMKRLPVPLPWRFCNITKFGAGIVLVTKLNVNDPLDDITRHLFLDGIAMASRRSEVTLSL